MAVFSSEEHLYSVVAAVFEKLAQQPEKVAEFTHSNLVIRINLTDPNAQLLLDGRQPPLEVFYGKRPGKANLEFTMEADLLHNIWLGQASASQAFFSGRIKTQGNLLKATSLIDLFRECRHVYLETNAELDRAI